jgi:transglutaminase-like putative cysteine protease
MFLQRSWSFCVFTRRTAYFSLVACLISLIAESSAFGAKFQWDPISSAELAAIAPADPRHSDGEILFSRHTLNSDVTENYVRAKVYTKKGVDLMSVLSIDHGSAGELSQLVARVVKQNGSLLDLKKTEFHESVLWKRADMIARRTTFVFPNLEPGDVVEYRWIQSVPHSVFSYARYFCQAEEMFTREYTFEVKKANFDYDVIWANCKVAVYDPEKKLLTIRNLEPFRKEALMPPEPEFRGSITVVFTHPWLRQLGLKASWQDIGAFSGIVFAEAIKPQKSVIAKATELTGKSVSPTEMVAHIYRFVQNEITNLNYDNSPALAPAKKKRARSGEPQTPAQTLERRSGDSWDVTLLFASLVRATGLDTRLGMSADREKTRDIKSSKGWVLADRRMVAVNFGERFGFYTPGERFVPCGVLDKKDEGVDVFISNEREWKWGETPVAKPADTQTHRRGLFTLDEDGSLRGDVTIEYTGHRAMEARETFYGKSIEEGLTLLRQKLTERLVTGEPSDLEWVNAQDNNQPLIMRYKLHVPGYAEATGSRLLVPLNCFTVNSPAVFAAEERQFPITIPFAEQYVDEIEITLPPGYVLDGASAPSRVGTIATPVNSNYSVKYQPKTRTLQYRRDYVMGADGILSFRSEGYSGFRQLFDHIHRSDLHQVVLKQAVTAPGKGEAITTTPVL